MLSTATSCGGGPLARHAEIIASPQGYGQQPLLAPSLLSWDNVSVTQAKKVLSAVLRGTSDANIRFSDLCGLLGHLGFRERIKGDHHIFTKPKVVEIVNIQPKRGKAKPYQVKQVRGIILGYKLQEGAE